ncbi:heme ABC transporter ATP-binding protein [bacterium]|nr:heme ABC transporter ATP-binding protein [bacterium]
MVSNADSGPLLAVQSVSKAYGSVQALREISAEFFSGEVHAVLGENGAGKSTLMGMIGGFVVPDNGVLVFDGSELPVGKPFEVRGTGIRMVHQHFMLVPQLTVRENFALAQLEGGVRRLDADRLAQDAVEIGQKLGWEVDLDARAGELQVGAQQRVEILKALAGEARVLILDEPTAVLSPAEVDELFGVLRALTSQGVAVLLIAHKLSEVMAVADRVTVLRRGEFVASCLIGETNRDQLAEWMVGEMPEPPEIRDREFGEVVVRGEGIRAKDDRGVEVVCGIDLEVRAGEILGVGGVDGNGQVELAEVLAGVRMFSGQLEGIDEVGYIPQDRQSDGLALGMSIEENMLLGSMPKEVFSGIFVLPGKVRNRAHQLIEEFQIKFGSAGDSAGSLSGGNQQKIVAARTLSQKPRVVVAVNPTRGLDLKATDYVHSRLLQAADEGAAVFLFSTDLDELAALADRTVYMDRGRFTEEFLVGSK